MFQLRGHPNTVLTTKAAFSMDGGCMGRTLAALISVNNFLTP
jgi:hypothetical protein